MCTVPLPPGVYPISVEKYIIINININNERPLVICVNSFNNMSGFRTFFYHIWSEKHFQFNS